MKKALILSSLALLLLAFLPGCAGTRTATLRVSSSYVNTSVFIPEAEREPEPGPVWDTVTVSRGTKLMNGLFRVKKLTADTVTLLVDGSYAGASYLDGQFVQRFEAGEPLTLRRGETLRLTETGLLDEDHTVTVVWDGDRKETT